MKIVLDTNVFISGIFWGGPPYQILKAWQAHQISLVISQEILDEYDISMSAGYAPRNNLKL